MKLDLHMHPLCHEYYDGWSLPHHIKELTSTDKERIRVVVDWCIVRKMDVISITDHDMVLSSLYAIEYVKEQKLPIIVLSGIEMELHHRGVERVHLCAWGIKEQPRYAHITPVDEVVKQIHEMGGLVIMNHPQFSPQAFSDCRNLMDGYEYINSDKHVFEAGREFLKMVGHVLPEYRNSDFHYDPFYGPLPVDSKYHPKYINEWDDETGKEWLKQFGY